MKTKNLLIAFMLLFFSVLINAQVKVLSNGKVGIGTNNPKYGFLEIGKSGVNNGLAIYDSLSSKSPFQIYSLGDYTYFNYGGLREKGFRIRKDGHIDVGASPKVGGWEDIINVYVNESNPRSVLMADVNYPFDYGYVFKVMSKSADIVFLIKNRNSNGDHTFRLYGDGTVYSKGNILTASDEIFKDNIEEISDGLEKIKKMKGVTYTLKNQIDNKLYQVNNNNVNKDTKAFVSSDIVNKIEAEKKRKKVGFIAQELEKVFPEVVYTTIDGTKAIAYSEIIPLLVEAIKDQQIQIDKLKEERIYMAKSSINVVDEKSDHSILIKEKLESKLYSNIPNPFKEQTTISYFISENASTASIHIYNLQGKQIKQINIEEKGNSSVVINGYELTPGMYMYTLIVDGKEIDTKKMILTE